MKTTRIFLVALALSLLAVGVFHFRDTQRVSPLAGNAAEPGKPTSSLKADGNGVGAARDEASGAKSVPLGATAIQAAAGQPPPPGYVDLQDGYPIMGQQRAFFRRAGEVAIRARARETMEKLIAADGAFAGYTEVRTWPGGVTILRAPEAEVARQLAEPGRAQAWLAEVRAGGAAAMANPVLIDPPSGLMVIPFGEIIVRLKEGVEAARYFGADFARARRLDGTTDQFVVALKTTDFETTVAEIARHAARAEVVWAEPNFICEVRESFIPNDPLYPDQWHLGGDTSGLIGYNRADVSAETAWDTTRGEPDVVVAVVEFRGFDIDHEDLAPNLFINPSEIAGNGIDDDNNGVIDDITGYDFYNGDNNPRPATGGDHGTAVAGVAIARGNNGIGVSGAAPRCRFLPVNIGQDTVGQATALRYCAGLTGQGWRGADVVNMSIGVSQSATFDSGLAAAARKGRQGRGTVLLAAAGNSASAYQLVGWALTAGTHSFEWRYTKNGSVSVGEDAIYVDSVGFYDTSGVFTMPQYGSAEFGGGAPGFTSSGAQSWSIRTGSDRAVGIVDSVSAKSGAITHNQTTSLFYTKTMPGPGQIRFLVWVDSELTNDTFQFFIDGVLASPGGTFSGPSATTVAPSYPASHPDVICVGASTDYDLRADYSQYGAKLEIVAPSGGGDLGIVTTDRTGAVGYDPGNYGSFRQAGGFGGTSSASPLASGVAALALSVNPWMTRTKMRTLLRVTADEIGGVTYDGSGHNIYYGFGRVNAALAVLAARGPQPSSYTQNFNASANDATELYDGSSFFCDNQRQTNATVAGWVSWANVGSHAADAGSTANVNVSVLATQGGTGAITFADAADGAGPRAFCTGWTGGAGTKAWLIPVNTAGRQSLTFSCRMMGTNTPVSFSGPRDFKLQYSLDGATWADVAGGTIAAGNGLGTFTSLTNVALPLACDDQPALQLRLLMTSNTDVQGGTVSGGQSHLDDVVISGAAMFSSASVQGGALRLHEKAGGNTTTVYALPNFGSVTHGFEASFRYRLDTSGVANPGNGFSFNYGPLRDGVNSGPSGWGQGLSVAFLTAAGEAGHRALVDGVLLPGGSSSVAPVADGAWHSVKIRWRETAGTGVNSPSLGSLTVSVDDVAILRDVPANFAPEATDTIAFTARTLLTYGEDLFLDDVSVQPIGPERYSRSYDGYPLNQTALSDGSVTSATVLGSVGVDVAAGRIGYRLAKNSTLFNLTSYALPTLSADCTQGFEATFLYYIASTFATPADGFAFNFGNLASTNSGPGGLADGLAVSFDIFSANNHRVIVDGAVVPGGTNAVDPFVDGQWHAVKIRWEKTAGASGVLALTVDGVPLFDGLTTSGFTATPTDRFVFTAFTGAYAADVLIDDVAVRPLFTSPFSLDPVLIRRTPNANPDFGIFPLRWGSVPGRNHRVEFSDDLVTWQTANTFAGTDGFGFLTPVVSFPTTPKRFYRVIRE